MPRFGASLGAVLLFLSPLLAPAAPLDVVPLPYAADKYKAIDAETMTLHHDKHYTGYVSKYNAAVAAASNGSAVDASTPLPVALSLVGSPSLLANAELNTAVRNQGGGAWNHALFWKILSPLGAPETRFATAASPQLKRAVEDFGALDGLRAALAKAAGGVFGSGWAFLCASVPLYGVAGATTTTKVGATKIANATSSKSPSAPLPPPRLSVVSFPNQDSPLTGLSTSQAERCVPIAAIDVWEHAYYLKYRNLRPAYVEAVLGGNATDGLINWSVVSENYARLAKAAEIGGDAALLAAAGEIGQA